MTRYTRGTKSTTHQRGNPGSATPWQDLSDSTHTSGNKSSFKKKDNNGEASASSTPGGPKLVKLFGQFWVPQSEAKRLQKLITKLKGEGLSRKVISESLRNEIRRAEKKAKRSKDKTCFSCRQYGHLLADCPNKAGKISDNNNFDSNLEAHTMEGVEICFKCGSTEHTSRRCIKNKDNETFKFAKCFICQQTGHISRQCPNNQHGIYPAGGGCNECGESGHLIKDCPKVEKMTNSEGEKLIPKSKEDDATCASIFDPMMSTEYEPIAESWGKQGDGETKTSKMSNSNNSVKKRNSAVISAVASPSSLVKSRNHSTKILKKRVKF